MRDGDGEKLRFGRWRLSMASAVGVPRSVSIVVPVVVFPLLVIVVLAFLSSPKSHATAYVIPGSYSERFAPYTLRLSGHPDNRRGVLSFIPREYPATAANRLYSLWLSGDAGRAICGQSLSAMATGRALTLTGDRGCAYTFWGPICWNMVGSLAF